MSKCPQAPLSPYTGTSCNLSHLCKWHHLLLSFSSQKPGCHTCFSLPLNPFLYIQSISSSIISISYSLKQDIFLSLLLLTPSPSNFHFLPRQLHWPLLASLVWLLAAPIYSPHDGKSKNWIKMSPCLKPPIAFHYILNKMYTHSDLTGPAWSGPYLAQWLSHSMLILSAFLVLLSFCPLKQNEHFVRIKIYRCCNVCL